MFSYKIPVAIITTLAFLQPPIVIARDIAEVNNIARNISVKITGYGNGSGFILDREENIYSVVTNKHVVPIDTDYQVQTHDGTKHQVTNRQEIPNLDLAIIQFVSTNEYQVAELGDSEELVERQFVSVAGFPGEQTDIDIIDGQIRSIRQDIVANPAPKQGYALIYTNQTLPGSSGGAVLDEDGRVIAINGEGETDIKTGREISRGIPINVFLALRENLVKKNNSFSATTSNSNNLVPNNTPAKTSTSSIYQLSYTISSSTYRSKVAVVSGNKIVSGNSDNTISVWNLTTGELEQILSDHSSWVSSVIVSGNKIISGSKDGTIKVWNLATGELEQTLTNDYASVSNVAVSGNKIVSGNEDGTIKVWNLATGELEQTLSEHSDIVNNVAISGNIIVSSSKDGTVKVWDLMTGEFKQTLTHHSDIVSSMVVSGNKIVSGKENGTIEIWNLTTGKLEQTLSEHSDWIFSVAINGDKLVSGSTDGTIKVWNLATGELEQTLSEHSDWIFSVAISRDKLVSISRDKTIKVWQLLR